MPLKIFCLAHIIASVAVVATAAAATDASAQASASSSDKAAEGASAKDAPSADDGSKFDLDVAESLASKRSGVPQESPAIITTARTRDILSAGYLTLNSFLTTVPGFHPVAAYWHDWPGVRGVRGSVSFMIDGVSYTNPVDYRYPAGLGLFLEEFDRFEMISGPAGVLWGAHSLLGTVNALTSQHSAEGVQVRSALGLSDLSRVTVRSDQKVGHGNLRLFLGYASERKPVVSPEYRIDGVRPFSTGLELSANSTHTQPSADFFGLFSAHYTDSLLNCYLRLPISRERAQFSDLGALLSPDSESQRDSVNPFAFITLQRTFLSGQLAAIARGVWYGLYEHDDRTEFPQSDVVTTQARSIQELWMSQFSLVGELSYRLRTAFVNADLMGGAEGSALVPHASSFAQAEPSLNGTLVDQGLQVKTGQTPTSLSSYVWAELQSFERFSLGGGARYNRSNSYLDVWLFQASTGLRLIGKSYVKFNYTQGFRPPTLLDRAGLQPVIGRPDLTPETSVASQAEFNVAGSWPGIMRRGFLRTDYSRTQVSSLITREGQRFVPYRVRPVSTAGLAIDAFEFYADAELEGGILVQGMYENNKVRNLVQETDEVQVQRVIPNHGPRHRWLGSLGFQLGSYASMRGSSYGQCGGLEYSAQDGSNKKLGCYPLFGLAIQAPVQANPLQVTVSLDNIADTRIPAAYFSQPQLGGATPPVPSTTARTVFVMLTWNNTVAEDL